MNRFQDENRKIAELLFPNINISIHELEKRFPKRNMTNGAEVTRFAPSITGQIHLGGLYAALISNKLAVQSNGIFYLRIEDIGQNYAMEENIRKTVSDLEKFGIFFDEGPFIFSKATQLYGPYRQSERKYIYQVCAKQLVMEGYAYPSFYDGREVKRNKSDSRRELREADTFMSGDSLTLPEITKKFEENCEYVIRIKSPGKQGESDSFHDLVKGDLEMPVNTNDVIIMRSDGTPTYHFAHVVDDYYMGTTTVVRGDEWLSSWPIHRQIFQLCGFEEPKYAHISSIVKTDGKTKRKLSKNQDEEAVSEYYYKKGIPVTAIIEYLLTIVNSNYEEWNRQNSADNSSEYVIHIDEMSNSCTLLDIMKLKDISRNYIANLSVEECFEEIVVWAREYDYKLYEIALEDEQRFMYSIEVWKSTNEKKRKDVCMWSELYDTYNYLYNPNWLYENSGGVNPKYGSFETKAVLSKYAEGMSFSVNRNQWLENIKEIASATGYAVKRKAYEDNSSQYKGTISDFCAIIRMALTGSENSPDLYDIMQFLGEKEVRSRLNFQIQLKSFVCDYVDTSILTKSSIYEFKKQMSSISTPKGCFTVSTCLRYEIFGVNLDESNISVKKNMVHIEGKPALSRLIRLLVGEYSELRGEIEIRNQVRKGLKKAHSDGCLQDNEYKLIEEIVRFADGLRKKYQLTNKENYSTLAYQLLLDKWENERHKFIMIFGDGYMAQAFYEKAKHKDYRFVFVNRDVKKAKNIWGTPNNAVHITYQEMELFVPLVDTVFVALSNVDKELYKYEELFQDRDVCIIDISYPAVFEGTFLKEYYTLENFDWTQISPYIHRDKKMYLDIERFVDNKCIE